VRAIIEENRSGFKARQKLDRQGGPAVQGALPDGRASDTHNFSATKDDSATF